jgi:hypothetical protein
MVYTDFAVREWPLAETEIDMSRIKVTGEWKDGGITVYGVKHTICVELVGGGIANVVCEKTRTGARLLGIERIAGGNINADEPPRKQHIAGMAISAATWKRLYRDDSRRRSYYA